MADKWHPKAHEFTLEEDAYIAEHYPKLGKAAVANQLGISLSSIQWRVRQLGLKKWVHREWTEEECNVVRELFPQHGSKKCAVVLDRPYTAVQKKANELGVDREYAGEYVSTDGYRMLRPDRSKSAIRTHRVIASEALGRKLRDAEIVHHLDTDPLNNSIDNLLITSRKGHLKIHTAMRLNVPPEELQDIVCSNGKTIRELLEASSS
jgi:hypothetical protein